MDKDKQNSETTHFGYQEVPLQEKAGKVADVFHSVAEKYDVMNDLMSFGVHRLWKRYTIKLSGVRRGQRVLDLAGGTGDLALRFAQMVGPEGQIVLSDINAAMLEQGRKRLIDRMSDTSRMVDRLHKKGLVSRAACCFDRRLVDITLTKNGEDILGEIDTLSQRFDQCMCGLQPDEAQKLSDLLDKLRSSYH